MFWVAGVAIVAGAGISAYGKYASAKQAAKGHYDINAYGQLNPEQIELTQQVGPHLQEKIDKGAEQYTGDYTAPLGAGEFQTIERQSQLGAMSGSWANKFQPGYIDPEIADTTWKDLNKKFYGDAMNPGTKALTEEQFAGTGGYWGDARARGVMGEYQNTVADPYNTWRSNALQNSYANALAYGTAATNINTATQKMQAVSRELEQYGLDKKYQEWVRAQDKDTTYINQALAFLGLKTVTAEYKPAGPSFWGEMAQGIGGGIQQAGMMYGMQGMNTPSSSPSLNSGVYGGNNAQLNAMGSQYGSNY